MTRVQRRRSVPDLDIGTTNLEQAGCSEHTPRGLDRGHGQLQRADLLEVLRVDGPGAAEVRSTDLAVPHLRQERQIASALAEPRLRVTDAKRDCSPDGACGVRHRASFFTSVAL